MRISVIISLSWLLILGEALAIEPTATLGRGTLNQLSFLPDGRLLRVLVTHIEIVDPDGETVLASFAAHSESIRRVDVGPHGKVAVVRRSRIVELWDILAQEKLHQWDVEYRGGWSGGILDVPFVVAFRKSEPLLVINDGTDQLLLRDWETGELVGKLQDKRKPAQSCVARSGKGWSSKSCNSGPPHIFSMAVSPDDRFLVVGSKRPDAEIWDLETGKLVGHLEGHGDWVSDVAYSPNGQWIATTKPQSTKVYLWDADTRQLVRTWLNGDIGSDFGVGTVFELFFSRDSKRLYVATRSPGSASTNTFNDRVRIWDVETHTLVNEIRPEPIALRNVSLSPDESRMILQYRDQVAVLWDMEQNRRLRLWADYTGRNYSVLRVSPDGKSLVQLQDTLIKIWNVPSRSLRHVVFAGAQGYREAMTLSPDGSRFAVGLYTYGTEIRDTDTGKLLAHIPEARGFPSIAFNSRGDRIATMSNRSSSVVIIDIDHPDKRQLLNSEGERTVALSRDDRFLAVTDRNKRMHLWEQEEEGYRFRYAWSLSDDIYYYPGPNLVFHPHATPPILVGTDGYDTVVVWELRQQAAKELHRINGRGPVHFSADGRYLLLNGRDGLQIWNWRSNMLIEHPLIPRYSDINQDGSVLVTPTNNGQIQTWNLKSILQPKPVVLGEVKKTALLPNCPNPFNPETWMPYRLSEFTNVRIRIHDVSGRQVRVLELGANPAGDYLSRSQAAYWDGRNDAGEPVSSGLYFYTLETGESRTTRRMNLLK